MPEGPELKLSAELIKTLVIGKVIKMLDFPNTSRYHINSPNKLNQFLYNDKLEIQNVSVKGKFMYWDIGNWYIFITYGMAGQFSPKPGKHICMHMQLLDNRINKLSDIYFNDPRHFGTIKFTDNASDLANKLQELGWDPLTMPLDQNLRWIAHQLSKTNKPIAEVLMNQKIFAGVGNYIRAECLYASKLSPWHQANKLSHDKIKILCQAVIDVMQESYQHQGATIHTYKTVYGEEGKYSTFFKVYDQKQDPLGNKIIKQQTADKRTIHWCPDIQI